jgi:heme-degrading monooxygenase HmoA
MIAAKFVFRQHTENDDFHRLNDRIREVARSHPGYLGREWWRNDEGDLAVIYYWETLEDLTEFARDPVHRKAKARVGEWYEGYRVEISRVLRTYGDAFYDGPAGEGDVPRQA